MESIFEKSINDAVLKRIQRQKDYWIPDSSREANSSLESSSSYKKNNRRSNYYVNQDSDIAKQRKLGLIDNTGAITEKGTRRQKYGSPIFQKSNQDSKSVFSRVSSDRKKNILSKDYKKGYIDTNGRLTASGEVRNKKISNYLLERQSRPSNSKTTKTAAAAEKAVTESTGVFKGVGKHISKHKGKYGAVAAVAVTAMAMNKMTPKYDIPLDNLPASQRKQKLEELLIIQKNMQNGVY